MSGFSYKAGQSEPTSTSHHSLLIFEKMANIMFEDYCSQYYGDEGLTSTMFIIDSKNYDAALENAKEFESLWLISKETEVGLWNSIHYIKAEL